MLRPERYDRIVKMVNAKTAVTVEELCDELEVSKATIRRDLLQLDNDKMLIRTHGGAMMASNSKTAEVPIYLRSQMQKDAKERIGAAAAGMIHEGQTIYVGAGSTARVLAGQLASFHQLTVLTNDIGVAAEVAATNNALIVAGGQLKKSSFTLTGFFTELVLKEMQVDTAFFAVDAVNTQSGLMDCGIDEVNIKRIMIENSQKCVLLCDSNKFRRNALITICPLTDMDLIITNSDLDAALVNRLEESGIEIMSV